MRAKNNTVFCLPIAKLSPPPKLQKPPTIPVHKQPFLQKQESILYRASPPNLRRRWRHMFKIDSCFRRNGPVGNANVSANMALSPPAAILSPAPSPNHQIHKLSPPTIAKSATNPPSTNRPFLRKQESILYRAATPRRIRQRRHANCRPHKAKIRPHSPVPPLDHSCVGRNLF